jgi:hypothetical protein
VCVCVCVRARARVQVELNDRIAAQERDAAASEHVSSQAMHKLREEGKRRSAENDIIIERYLCACRTDG